MAKWASSLALRGGLDYVKANTTAMWLISSYTAGESYSTIQARILASVTTSSADFTLATGSASSETLTTASKTDPLADANGGGATNHIAFVNTAGSAVLLVTPESSGQTITINNPIVIGPIVYTIPQPG